jgi:hypothetical protein
VGLATAVVLPDTRCVFAVLDELTEQILLTRQDLFAAPIPVQSYKAAQLRIVLLAPTAICGTASVYLRTDPNTKFGDSRRAYDIFCRFKENLITTRIARPTDIPEGNVKDSIIWHSRLLR